MKVIDNLFNRSSTIVTGYFKNCNPGYGFCLHNYIRRPLDYIEEYEDPPDLVNSSLKALGVFLNLPLKLVEK